MKTAEKAPGAGAVEVEPNAKGLDKQAYDSLKHWIQKLATATDEWWEADSKEKRERWMLHIERLLESLESMVDTFHYGPAVEG